MNELPTNLQNFMQKDVTEVNFGKPRAAGCMAGGSCLFPATRTDEATPAWQAPARLTIARRSCTASRQILDDIPNIPNIPKSFRRVLYKNLNTGLVNMSQTRTVRYFGTG